MNEKSEILKFSPGNKGNQKMNTIKWIGKGSGKGRWYVSECGRFRIANHSLTTRKQWILFDSNRTDPMFPGPSVWNQYVTTLESGKRYAEVILRKERQGLATTAQ